MNVLPSIAQEVVNQCKRQGTEVPLPLSTLYVRTQLLLAKKDAQNNVELASDAIEQLANGCVRNLLDMSANARWHTLLLQSSVSQAQHEQLNRARTDRVQKKAKAHRLAQEVLAKRNDVFPTIVLNIIHEAHPQSMTDESVQRSVSIALDAVFPRRLMEAFVSQSDAEKSRQLHEMTFIVVGMRLFQFASGKDVPGVSDLVSESRSILNATVGEAIKLDSLVSSQITDYSNVLTAPSLKMSDHERTVISDEHHGRLQLRLYTKSLLHTIRDLTARIDEAAGVWEHLVADAMQLFSAPSSSSPATRAAEAAAGGGSGVEGGAGAGEDSMIQNATGDGEVPKSAVYPKWVCLADHWEKISALFAEANDTAEMLRVISAFETVPGSPPALKQNYIDQARASLVAPNQQQSQQQKQQQTPEERNAGLAKDIAENFPAVEYVPRLTSEKRDTRLEFNGFCLPTFVETNHVVEGCTEDATTPGFLLLRANSAYYSFSSARALKNFAKDPYRYLSPSLMTTIASDPPLIYLLGLHPYLPKEVYLYGSRKVQSADSEAQMMAVKAEATTQTGHVPNHKDTHYIWDEWELRRLALQLAALRTKRTKSTQTNLSHFRRENDTQVFLPKTQGTQTLVDAATQPPRVVRYLAGLRGTESSAIQVIEKEFQY